MSFFAVHGEAVAGAAVQSVKGCCGDAAHVPDAVVVGVVLPLGEVAVDSGRLLQEGDVDVHVGEGGEGKKEAVGDAVHG